MGARANRIEISPHESRVSEDRQGLEGRWGGRARVPARRSAYFFFSPRETGLPAPELAVARIFGVSFFGFLASLFPR